jgi:phenylacetate-CoA ligase
MLTAFAEYVERRGLPGHSLGLKAIVTTSEVLSDPQRQLLERAFHAPVQVEYGCGEVGPIAYECTQGSLHLLTTELLVEILRPDGSAAQVGETGEVVLTDLNNLAMPLLRYRISDFAVLGEPCGCGRALPTLARIWGREYDFVGTPDGKRYHGEFFMYLMEDLRTSGCHVRAFQVDQTAPDALTVRLVVDALSVDSTRASVERAFAARLPQMTATIEFVPRIERAASGKMRIIRNLLAPTAREDAVETTHA